MSRAAQEPQPDELPIELTITSSNKMETGDAQGGADAGLPDAPEVPPDSRSGQKRPRTREQARELAAQEALKLEEVNDKIAEAALQMRDLFSRDRSALPTPQVISPASTQSPMTEAPETARETRKRKRNSERDADLPAQLAAQLTSPKRSKKKQKLAPTLNLANSSPTPGPHSPHAVVTTTTYVPLAPAGVSSPMIKEQSASPGSPPESPPFRRHPPTPTATAAFSRPRRGSGAMRQPTSSPLRSRAESDLDKPRGGAGSGPGSATTRARGSVTPAAAAKKAAAKKSGAAKNAALAKKAAPTEPF